MLLKKAGQGGDVSSLSFHRDRGDFASTNGEKFQNRTPAAEKLRDAVESRSLSAAGVDAELPSQRLSRRPLGDVVQLGTGRDEARPVAEHDVAVAERKG